MNTDIKRTMYDLTEEEKKTLFLDVVRSWEKEDAKDIAKRHNTTKRVIVNAASRMRKLGIPLAKKGHLRSAYLDKDFIEKLKDEFRAH